jgi:uncharacterized membrane protein
MITNRIITNRRRTTMIEGAQLYLVAATALAAGLMSGVFYAFSSFVMAGLRRLPSPHGMAAMQSINITAVEPGLMIPFFGTLIGAVAVAVTAVVDWDGAVSVWLLAGAASYTVGTFAMTAGYHVPRNNALEATGTNAPDAASVWGRYLEEWTSWNHLRALTSMVTALAFTIAIVLG